MIESILGWLEASALAEGLRGLGIWTYGLVNLAHLLGIATLFGAIVLLDLRLLGAWRSIPIPMIARPSIVLAAVGFAVAITSGVMMLSFNATEYLGNPFLYVKIPVIVLGLTYIAVVQRFGVWQRAMAGEPAQGRDRIALPAIGGFSLVVWLTVLTCGRMIGYW